MSQKKYKTSGQSAASHGQAALSQMHGPESHHDSSHNDVMGSMLPSTKTQAQPTPMPSLSPVLAHSPA